MQDILKKIVQNINLSEDETTKAMRLILEGEVCDSLTGAFLTALRMKGETVEEITAGVKFLQNKAQKLNMPNALDIVGTGGDGANTFNITTASAFVIASGGVMIAKHGNRASSSLSGSSDVLEALGCKIDLGVEENKKLLSQFGICFMFAPKYNPIIKNVAKVRRELKIRTIFNLFGPLINPSCAQSQVIGVYDKKLVEVTINVMKNLGIKRGITLFGECGLDEASVSGKTYYASLFDNKITTGAFTPEDFNLKSAPMEDIRGGDKFENASIIKGIFEGKIKGAKKDIVVLNSALGFYCAGKVNSIKEGVQYAENLIESSAANTLLNNFIKGTNNEYFGKNC